jgi:PAS domain S-box-containing protein
VTSSCHPTAGSPSARNAETERWLRRGALLLAAATGLAGVLTLILAGQDGDGGVSVASAVGFGLAALGMVAVMHCRVVLARASAAALLGSAAWSLQFPVSASASFAFALLAVAIGALSPTRPPRVARTIAGGVALAVMMLGTLALAIEALGLPIGYGWGLYSRMADLTAAALCIAGAGVLATTMRCGSRAGVSMRRWVPALSSVAMASATLVMWQAIVEHDRQGDLSTVQQQAESMAGELARRSVDRALLLDRLTGRWTNESHPNLASWAFSTAEWLRDYPGMLDLAWADSTFTVRWAAPPDSGAVIGRGHRLTDNADVAEAIRGAIARQSTQATAPTRGGSTRARLLLVSPVRHDDRVNGFMTSGLDAARFVDDVFAEDVTRGYAFAVYDGGILLGARDPADVAPANRWQVVVPINVMGRRWTLIVVPTNASLAATSSAVPTVFLVLGMLWSALLGWIVLTAQRSRELTARLAGLVRELAEENGARRESEQMRAALVHSTLDGVAAFDASGCVSAWNPRMAQLTGRDESEVDGEMIGEMVPFLPSGSEVPLLLDALAGRRTDLHDVRTLQATTGEEIWLDISVTPMRSADGRTLGGLLVARDVTERKRLADVMLAGKLAAEEASRAKSDFLARMSHELRTPLNAVIGFTNVMRRNRHGRLERDELTYLERISANGRHLLGLINEVLDLAKIESGHETAELAPVSIATLVRDTLAELDVRASGASVRLSAQLPTAMREATTDEAKLKQVLINLIGNAIKFTPPAGRVTVRVTTDAAGRPSRLDVEDTGLGIPSERQRAIFEAFEQVDTDTARRFGGTGLGLAISRRLCELMGHELVVQSDVGVGSTFSIILGLPQPDQAVA